MIPARATVDALREPTAIGMGSFRVEVWGDEPHDYVRVYTIDATSDTLAAQEGLRRFVDEIELMLSKEG
jgi:hypothetical protein